MVSYIPAGTISGQEALTEVGVRRKTPDFLHYLVVIKELQDVKTILVLRRALMLRCKAVVDGDNNSVGISCNVPAKRVVREGGRRKVDKASAMEVYDDGERTRGRRFRGKEDAKPEVARRVKGMIKGGDAIDRGGRRR